MKKYALLTILLLASFKSISQNVTPPKPEVRLSDTIAKAVIKDLIKGDACNLELKETQRALTLTEKKVNLLQSKVKNLESQKLEYVGIVDLKDQQISSQGKVIADTEKLLLKQKTTSWVWKLGTVAGILTSGYLLLR